MDNTDKWIAATVAFCVTVVIAGLVVGATYLERQRNETLRVCLSSGGDPDACSRIK